MKQTRNINNRAFRFGLCYLFLYPQERALSCPVLAIKISVIEILGCY